MFGTHSLALFIVTGLALNAVPGPDSLLVMTHSASRGWRGGSIAALGIGTGTLVHIAAAALGMSALLATSAAAFNLVKYVGAAYVVYMAVGLLRHRPRSAAGTVVQARVPLRKIFLQGFLSNVLNPKVALFFLAFLPQYIAADAPDKVLAFVFLGGVFNLNGMLWCHALAVLTAHLSSRFQPNPRLVTWLSRATGVLFLWVAVRLALARQA